MKSNQSFASSLGKVFFSLILGIHYFVIVFRNYRIMQFNIDRLQLMIYIQDQCLVPLHVAVSFFRRQKGKGAAQLTTMKEKHPATHQQALFYKVEPDCSLSL